ncbi:MAG TPA: A24 family peptidase [Bryobacteraceae bacterium]|nr:A24 family peptidase [Bryobacteraceae bacterium]
MLTYLPPVLQVLLVLIVVTAGIYDIRFRRIPNWLVLTGVVLGFGLNIFMFELVGLKQAALGMGLALLIYFPLYALRAMGAGDAKLMAAVGSIVGPGNWIVLFVLTSLLGGLTALVVLLLAGRFRKTFWNVGWIMSEVIHLRAPYKSSEELDVRSAKGLRMPHGAVIALGSIAFLAGRAIWGK